MVKQTFIKYGLNEEEFKAELSELIDADWSMPRIAEKYKCSSTAIMNWLVKFNLKRRSNLRDYKWLSEKYLMEQLSAGDIAKICGVTEPAVQWHLTKAGIHKRSLAEAQQLANPKRGNSPLHYNGSYSSLGYCIASDGYIFRSAIEFLWYELNKSKHDIQYEPIIYQNQRPDFLVDNKNIVEIKSFKKSLSEKDVIRYIDYGKRLTTDLGYTYEIVFAADLYKKEYIKLLKTLKTMNATIGQPFSFISSPFIGRDTCLYSGSSSDGSSC